MNILFILPDITTHGGVERITSLLANIFVKKGYDVTVASLFKRMTTPAFNMDNKVRSIFITEDDYNLKKGRIRLLPIQLKAFLKLKKYLISNQHDLIISQCFLSALFVYLNGYAHQSIVCDHFKYELYRQPIRAVRNFIYSKFKRVVTLTRTDANKYKKTLNNVLVITNISPFTVSNYSDLSSKRIIAIGRLHPQKGFDLLLDAVKDLFIDFPDWRLDIYGEGEEYKNLIRKRDNYALQSFVNFAGYTENVKEEMLKSSIYVLSSRYEGLPMVLLEALSCALPIIAFKCPEGPADLLKNNIGYLVEAENTTILRKALIEMMSDHLLREEYAEKEKVAITAFSSEAVFKKWQDLFQTLSLHS